ncbi:hypothetical protein TEA_019352 [Camellia sinensis var. sinensis]|uniref:Uncharacterized protein n=1 Tax=Camellia sinensis var. sinensis TaxID=542762 RepID=A0A4S4EGB1_CAMSN|nr:hypothetical protein TEA_019352 [Camellia sinensis var. sinensis]
MNSPFIVLSKAFSSEGREREKEGRRERDGLFQGSIARMFTANCEDISNHDYFLVLPLCNLFRLKGLVRKGKKIYGEKEVRNGEKGREIEIKEELQIDSTQYDHPIALTVEAQDKKHRFYVVSAFADTKVDLKAKAGNPSNDTQKEKSANVKLSSSFTNPEKFIEEILERTSTIVLSEVSRVYAICNFKASSGLGLRKQTIQIKEETIKQHGEQLGTLVSNSIRKHLNLDFINLATILKNTAYTEGFHAGFHLPKTSMFIDMVFPAITFANKLPGFSALCKDSLR